MLKGHVFKGQTFRSEIFALFIDTFLNKTCGVAGNYKNKMAITVSGNTIAVASGCACIKGRFVEEDGGTTISTDAEDAYCKLVIEVNLDEQNTSTDFKQASYKIIKSTSDYPNLTQEDIIEDNSGIYQLELAKFKTSSSGITYYEDTRTFLDFESIYEIIDEKFEGLLTQLQQELNSIQSGTTYVLRSDYAVLNGLLQVSNNSSESLVFDLPEGFTKENCVCLSYAYSQTTSELGGNEGEWIYGDFESFLFQQVAIYSAGVVRYSVDNKSSLDLTLGVRIVLKKIDTI